MRPTTVLSMVVAVLLGLGGVALGIFLIVDHDLQSVRWHYWIAPLLMIAAAGMLIQLTAMYMAKVGRSELRSRPPAE